MRIGESQAAGRQRINIWGFYQAAVATVATNVADSEIIGQDDHDVRRSLGSIDGWRHGSRRPFHGSVLGHILMRGALDHVEDDRLAIEKGEATGRKYSDQ